MKKKSLFRIDCIIPNLANYCKLKKPPAKKPGVSYIKGWETFLFNYFLDQKR